MSTAERTVIIVEMLISCGVVLSLIWFDSFAVRAGMGVAVLATIAPLTIRWGVHSTTKSGKDQGETRILAALVREHIKLQDCD